MRRLLFLFLIEQTIFNSLEIETEEDIKVLIEKLVKRENGELEVKKVATEKSPKDSDVFYVSNPKKSKYFNPDPLNTKQTEDKLDTVEAENDFKSPITRSDRTDPPNFEDFITKQTKKKSADANGEDLDKILKLISHRQFSDEKVKNENLESTREEEPLTENAKPNIADDSEEQGEKALFRSALPENKIDSILEANRRWLLEKNSKGIIRKSYVKGVSDIQRNGFVEGAIEPGDLKQKLDGAYNIDWMLNKLQKEHLETHLAKHADAIPNQTPSYTESTNRERQGYEPPVIQPPCGSIKCSNPVLEASIVHTRAQEAGHFLTGIPVASMGVFHRPMHRTVIYG